MNTLVHNIGTLISGDIEKPVLDADAILIKDSLIQQVGRYDELKQSAVDTDVDVRGMTLCPGLIDTHVHPVIGDWTPRMKTIGWMEGALHAGVTTLISQGEVLFPGRPRDADGVVALAILARKAYDTYRPGGIKAHCGALILEEGITEADIEKLARNKVWLFGEIGLGNLKDVNKIRTLMTAARRFGFKIPVHFGPESIPGASGLTVPEIADLKVDIISHFNGGPTSPSLAEMKEAAETCTGFLELVNTGNPRSLLYALKLAKDRNELNRIILGTDTPSGQGVMPTGMIRHITQISSLGDIPAAVVLCMATGNSARAYRLNTGLIKPGREADLLVIDAPIGSQGKTALEAIECGDSPFMGMVMVDGKVVSRIMKRSLNTTRKVLVNGQEEARPSVDTLLFG